MSAVLSRQVAILAQTPASKAMTSKQQAAIARASTGKETYADLSDAMKEQLKPCHEDIANGLRWDTAAGIRNCLNAMDGKVRRETAATELVRKTTKPMACPLSLGRY